MSASLSNENAAIPPLRVGNLATKAFSDAANKSGGTCYSLTIPITALRNGLQGILRDENDDMRV